jgi:signal transduction histidine kinase
MTAPRFRRGRGLWARIVLVMVVGMLGPVAILAWAGWLSLSELSRELVDERRLLARSLADHVEAAIGADLQVLQGIGPAGAAATGPDEAAWQQAAAVRQAFLRSRFLDAVLLLGDGGIILAEEPARLRHATPRLDLPAVRDVFSTGRPDVSPLLDEEGKRRLYLLVPLRAWDGRVVHVAAGAVDPASERFAALLRPFRLGERGSADVLDRQGVVIATTDAARRLRASDHDRFIEGLIRTRRDAAGTCHGCHDPGVVGGRVREVLAFAPLSVVPWGVAIRQPEEEAFHALGALRRRLLLLGPIALGIGLLFTWGAARSIRRPIRVLTNAAERIAGGALAEPIPPLGDDELGRLGRSLDQMRARLDESLGTIARTNAELERRVEDRTRELERANRDLAERDRSRAELLRKVITAQEQERKRVARELHDETSQSLTAVVMSLEAMVNVLGPGPERQRLGEIKAIAVRALDEVHRLLHDLRPSVLDDLGLTSAIRWCAERHLTPLGITVRCEWSGLEERLPPEIETALFRVVQEAVTNIARHSGADSVLIEGARRDRTVSVEIEDDGNGFVPDAVSATRPDGSGLGLAGMRERVALLGGTLEIESAPGEGTRVSVRVPVPAAAERRSS